MQIKLVAIFRMKGMPRAHDIVAVLIKLQVKADGIVGTATKAVIFFVVSPRVDDSFHNRIHVQSSLYNWGPPVFCLFFSDSAFGSFVNIYTANVGKITNSKSVISANIYEPK